MKGILLAGGSGTRLFPLTLPISKQLLPVFDKPMIYYPLSVLMLAGLKEILVISTPQDLPLFERLLGNGRQFGISISYAPQDAPRGIAEALIIAKSFLNGSDSLLILGDNIFYGSGFSGLLKASISENQGATLFAHTVKDPERFGVVEVGPTGEALSLEEKPKSPKSNFAVTGLYVYDASAPDRAMSLAPSSRGELEITDLNRTYLVEKRAKVKLLGRGFTWLDTGTHESLMEAGQFVQTIEKQQGYRIACLEEIGWRNGWLTPEEVLNSIKALSHNPYYRYVWEIVSSAKK